MSFETEKTILLKEFPDLEDENIILEKEIYAHFGLLFMKFSFVEHSLINIVTASHVGAAFVAGKIRSKSQWENAFDEGYEKAVKQTFGNLVKNVIKEPEFLKLEVKLKAQKEVRDYFAHHFFERKSVTSSILKAVGKF